MVTTHAWQAQDSSSRVRRLATLMGKTSDKLARGSRAAKTAGRAGRWAVAALAGLALASRADQWRLYKAADGLSESLSTAVTVSPRGNVWVKHGEVNAISMLDGYTIQHIPTPVERIYRVYQSRAGRIWAVYDEGLLGFVGNEWVAYPLTNHLTQAESNQLRAGRSPAILPAEEDRVLMLLPDRLVQFHAVDQRFAVLKRADDLGLGRWLDLAPAANGGLWLTAQRGVARFGLPVRRLSAASEWTEREIPATLDATNLHRPFEDDAGGLTMIAEPVTPGRGLLAHFDGTNWLARGVPDENLRFAWRDAESEAFWGVTLNKLLRFESNRVATVTPPLTPGQILDVAVQPRGVFWLATRQGLLRHAPSAWHSPAWPTRAPGLVQGLAEDAVGTLWVAAEAGLFGYRGNVWTAHAWPAGLEPAFQPKDGLFALADGALCLTVGTALWRFDPPSGRFAELAHPAGREVLRVLGRDEAGGLLVLTRNEAEPGDPPHCEVFDGRRFTEWTAGPPLPATGGEVFFCERARNGDWWVGTSAGPAWWRDGRWQFFGNADGYVDEGALCWLEMADGRIWCAGLAKVQEFDGKRWATVHSALDRANALLHASDGSVWVAANNGLHRFYRGAWLAVGESEGLPDNAAHCLFEDRQRVLWVGTGRGLSQYMPRADFEPPRTLAIEWEQQGSATGEGTGVLTFIGRDRWDFTPQNRLVFSYRLDEGEWSPYAPGNTFRLRGLTQGRHRVEARAMDRNWNVELKPASFGFRVRVPWYRDQRVVWSGLFGVLLAFVAAGFAVNRHWRLRRSYADVGRLVEERTRELERATAALAHSQKMTALGTLAAGIAHDFNNILSIVKGSAQIIAAHPADRDKVLTRVSRILTMVDQASDIVRALLGFGTATERRVKPSDLNEVVTHTLRLLSDRFRREITVECRLSPDLPPVRAAADLVQQMLLNLIFNAADAMDGRGRIEVTTGRLETLPESLVLPPQPAPAYGFVSVRDTGSGIPPEVLPRIFEPFFTTKALSARPGRGLGLFMVYEFAKEMGHGLRVESAVGAGSTFTVLMPVAGPE